MIIAVGNLGEEESYLVSGASTMSLGGFQAPYIHALDLNNSGVVTGTAGNERGVVWQAGLGTDVNDLIPDEVFSKTLTSCLAINDLNELVCRDADQKTYLIKGLPIDSGP